MGTCVQVNRYVVSCTCVLQRGQSGDVFCEQYDTDTDSRNGDLFALS